VPGPLAGFTVIELAGLGPGPFAAMLLADMGAEVIRVDRPGGLARLHDPLNRGRRSVTVDLKHPEGAAVVRRLCRTSDALIEGFRPGVTERLGVGPDDCLAENPALVYGRMTGWGQDGPNAMLAGHDINYISLSGALATIGETDGPPVPPLNLVGDFGGGGMLLAFGIVCALLEAQRSGQGQVIDASMVDGASLLMAFIYGYRARGEWELERGANRLDGGAPYYSVYRCADGGYVSVGCLEPQFYKTFVTVIGADPALLERQLDRDSWRADRAAIAAILATKTRAEWCELLERTDACVAPVLDLEEAPRHPHNVDRGTFVDAGGVQMPGPAPRFSRTVPDAGAALVPGRDTVAVLEDAGFSAGEIKELIADRAVHMEEQSAG
jgi:alpha-methylacyl-CoA racemase